MLRGSVLGGVPPALLALFMGACSVANTDDVSKTDPNANAFKTATAENVVAGAGVTNLIALPFSTPSDGFAWVSATGTCGVVEALPVSSVLAAQIETTPTAKDPGPGDSEFMLGGNGAAPLEGSFSATRSLPAQAGGNAVYLNVNNPSSGGTMYCSAAMMVLYSAHQLP